MAQGLLCSYCGDHHYGRCPKREADEKAAKLAKAKEVLKGVTPVPAPKIERPAILDTPKVLMPVKTTESSTKTVESSELTFKQKQALASKKWRESHKEEYRKYMREYSRKRRAES